MDLNNSVDHSINHAGENEIENNVKQWLQNVVIGLNLCPFAKHPFEQQRIHFEVCNLTEQEAVLQTLYDQCPTLLNGAINDRETTLIILPNTLSRFAEYNQFLNYAEGLLEQMGWQDELQIASFHSQYQFADTEPNDCENLTNRAPYPILHLLRQASLSKALEHYPHPPETIFENNIQRICDLSEQDKQSLFPYLSLFAPH